MRRQAWLLTALGMVGCVGQLGSSTDERGPSENGQEQSPSSDDESPQSGPGADADDGAAAEPNAGDGDTNGGDDDGDSSGENGDGDGAGGSGDGDGDAPDGNGDGDGTPDADAGPGGEPGDPAFPGALSECPDDPSIDRLESWLASGEGATVPATGSLLLREGDDYVARIQFKNAEWHVVPVLTANRFDGGEADFSSARGFWLTYSATDALYVQLRPSFAWDGGAKWLTAIPATHGQMVTRYFSFEPSLWTSLDALGTPPYTYQAALAAVRGVVIVGETPNDIVFQGLRVDGYEPPCL